MLCRRSQTISKRSTPQPSLRPRDRASACHMQSEWKIKTGAEAKTKTKATTKTKTMTSWVQACRLRPVARGCVQTAGHFHLVMVMVTAWIRDLGACRVGCYRISIASPVYRIPPSRKSLFILCNLLWNLNLKMKTDPERKRWRQTRRRRRTCRLTEAITAHVLADVIVSTNRQPYKHLSIINMGVCVCVVSVK